MEFIPGGVAVQGQGKIPLGQTAAVGIGIHYGQVHHQSQVVQPLLLQPATEAFQRRAFWQQQGKALRLLPCLLQRRGGGTGIIGNGKLIAAAEVGGGAAIGVGDGAQRKALRG